MTFMKHHPLTLGFVLWALLLSLFSLPGTAQDITRYPNGVTNVDTSDFLGKLPLLDPTRTYVWFNDFNTYTAGDWTITTTESVADASASEALSDAQFAAVVITNATADDDNDFLQTTKETFKFISGKETWFAARVKINETTESDWVIGLQLRDTSPLDVTDGVFFRKDDGDANIDLNVEKNNTATATAALDTIADDTYIELAFYYNGNDEVQYWSDNVFLGKSVTTYLPDDEELCVSFGIQNGRAGADYGAAAMTIDYIFVAQER